MAPVKQLKKAARASKGLFLGLDLSTQALKALVIDGRNRVCGEALVSFDRDLPEFKTRGGVRRSADGLTVTAPTIMWVAAMDLLMERLKSSGIPLGNIVAVSGSGQQHGSVWFRRGAAAILGALDPARTLRAQLQDAFSVKDSPVWMDSSTSRECRLRDKALGGPEAVATLTGSRSYERFTGNQIARIARLHPGQYRLTEHIALVSSFACSLLSGAYAPIDTGDGAGMNLMDIRTLKWSQRALDCTAADLGRRLPPLVEAHRPAGMIAPYYAARYGFSPATVVITFSGDNPNSLAAFGLDRAGAMAISLGTSDTVFGALAQPKPSASEGHIFGNPIAPNCYMALICYKNGSLTRERVRDEWAGGSWPAFNRLLAQTGPGNGGCIGFYFHEPEITPPVLKPGVYLFDATGKRAEHFTPGQHVRAVVEGQFLSMRLHCGNIGLKPTRIIATGGASVNKHILQVMADVFGRQVFTISQQNSAALGAALRARHGYDCLRAGRFVPFKESASGALSPRLQASPRKIYGRIYAAMLARYRRLEHVVSGSRPD